ncbi:MAG: glutamate-5-semialdehyde dehydrogenase [Clostridiales bacterium]|nr:glutamate-5-semialdehyde dehydrogenase [Clostridiales bacterium]
MSDLSIQASEAKKASRRLAIIDTDTKNAALANIAKRLMDNSDAIFEANDKDIAEAEAVNLEAPLLKRLKFREAKLSDVCDGIRSLIDLEEPVGKMSLHTTLDDGLELYRVTCPIGVVGVIFESRPDALVQIATLCLKSGNAVFLKGGREAHNTNKILAEIISSAGIEAGLPEGWLHLLTSREDVANMLSLNEYIDLIIPRGSNDFVKYIMSNTSIAVLGHADGVCHTYIDRDCDPDIAVKVAVDAKTQYVSVCNATETFLIDRAAVPAVLDRLVAALNDAGVELYGSEEVSKLLGIPEVSEWHHEYLDYKASVKIVEDVNEAIDHINRYGSGHTDAIITENEQTADLFMSAVDSGSVLVNCSTRFADGFRYGFGAEVGISTSKIHARGPVGLEGMVSYKYKLIGHGDIVDDYATKRKTFKHIRRDVK